MRAPFVLVAVATALAGCAAAPPAPDADDDTWSWLVYGTFSRGYTDEDTRAVCKAAERADDECGFMASEPLQYGFGYRTRAECERARARIAAVPHTVVRECAPDWQATPYGVAQWGFGGTFTEERTDEDMRRVCLAGARNESCAFAESFPERYGFLFASEHLCNEAREQVLAVPHTAGVSECRSEGGNIPPEAGYG